MKEDYPIFVHWVEVTDWVLDAAERLPKSARFTLSSRIANLSLDVLEGIVEAIYTRDRQPVLKRANMNLEKLRVLFRICHSRHYVSNRQYEYVSSELETAGKMLGGWRKAP